MRKQRGVTINNIIEFVRTFPLAAVLQLISIVTLVASSFIASRIAPLVQDIDTIRQQVHAMSESLQDRPALIQRYIVTEQQVKQLEKDEEERKEWQIRIEDKIDRILER